MENMAGMMTSIKKYQEAKQMLRYTVDIDKKAHGAEKQHVDSSLIHLTMSLQKTHLYSAEPAQLGQQALAIAEKTLGPDHPCTQNLLRNWGGTRG